jgi:hypothetical protein
MFAHRWSRRAIPRQRGRSRYPFFAIEASATE